MFYYMKKMSFRLLCAALIGLTAVPLPIVATDNPLFCSAHTLLKKNKKLIATLAAVATVCVLLSSSKIRSQTKNALAWTALAIAVRFGSTSATACKSNPITTQQQPFDQPEQRLNQINTTMHTTLNDSIDEYIYKQESQRNPDPTLPITTAPTQTTQPLSPAAQFALQALGATVEGGFKLYSWWNTPSQLEQKVSGPGNEDLAAEALCKENPKNCGIQ